jgi:glycerol-3-phosphate dehydrogenase
MFEENDGLFVGITDEDTYYLQAFLDGCEGCGIPAQPLTAAQALRLEPNLNPRLKVAVRVPDATVDAMRLPLRFFATARRNGARISPSMEVTDLRKHKGHVSGVALLDHVTGTEGEVATDVVVNAAGPWSEQIAAMAGVQPLSRRERLVLALLVLGALTADHQRVIDEFDVQILLGESWQLELDDDLALGFEDVRGRCRCGDVADVRKERAHPALHGLELAEGTPTGDLHVSSFLEGVTFPVNTEGNPRSP